MLYEVARREKLKDMERQSTVVSELESQAQGSQAHGSTNIIQVSTDTNTPTTAPPPPLPPGIVPPLLPPPPGMLL